MGRSDGGGWGDGSGSALHLVQAVRLPPDLPHISIPYEMRISCKVFSQKGHSVQMLDA